MKNITVKEKIWIRKLIFKTDLDFNSLAKRIKTDPSNIRKWLRGVSLPSLQNYWALCELSKVDKDSPPSFWANSPKFLYDTLKKINKCIIICYNERHKL